MLGLFGPLAITLGLRLFPLAVLLRPLAVTLGLGLLPTCGFVPHIFGFVLLGHGEVLPLADQSDSLFADGSHSAAQSSVQFSAPTLGSLLTKPVIVLSTVGQSLVSPSLLF